MSSLSFVSTSSFRNVLMGKNLPPYSVPGTYTPNIIRNYEPQINDFSVIDSPGDDILKNKYSKDLYPLNAYGPNGGFGSDVVTITSPITQTSNQGEYDPNDTKLDIINEFIIDINAIENKYLPEGGYLDMVVIDNVEKNDKIYLPYWEPPSFNSSTYRPYEILTSTNPVGSNGNLSQDSYIAKLGAQQLKKLIEERISVQTQKLANATNFDSLIDRFTRNQIISGQELISQKNWRITLPENPLVSSQELQARIAGVYAPVSPIPGDYFQENESQGIPTSQKSRALNVINRLTGGALGPILNKIRNPSEIFLVNTGNGQRSALFLNLDYNRYQPSYDKNYGGILVSERLVSLAQSIINPNNGTINGGYYVGSKNAEPAYITSPPNQVPVNPFGKQIQAPVYGPTELANLYEGNEGQIRFGLGGKTLADGGSIDGEFVWVSPKYGGAAGYKATPGGGVGSLDEEYNLISSNYEKNESTKLEFKESSILDQTQRLINSADNVAGITKLKHVGNAINQVSKVFNDGYKEITKGSQVVKYTDFTTGLEKGIEYCRIFTKDNPYYTYADLQKTDGIVREGRRFNNSILDSTYNLNIAPIKGVNIVPNEKSVTVAKKYMFSIENLAWRTSSRPGFTYDELPDCEKGPNGGRVMWFPPYDIKFGDSSSAGWTPTEFMGRPEPIYTYKSTTRTGTLSWKIIVDNPSVLDLIVEEQLKDVKDKTKINSILDSFFAGCTKFDIYDLAKKFNKIPSSELLLIQEKLNNPRLTNEELEVITKTIPKESTGGNTGSGQADTEGSQAKNDNKEIEKFKLDYLEFGYYFENDIPKSSSDNYKTTYDNYTKQQNIDKYIGRADSLYSNTSLKKCSEDPTYCSRNIAVSNFFQTVVKDNYNILSKNFITDLNNILKEDKGDVTIYLVGSASAPGDVTYNQKLSQRRIDSVRNFLRETTFEGNINLKQYFENKKLTVKEDPRGEETDATPKGSSGLGNTVTCSNNIVGGDGKKTSDSQIYSVNAMSCRRVKISKIDVKEKPSKPENTPSEGLPDPNKDIKTVTTQTIRPKKPKPQKTISVEEKKGISKIVLRKLLTECDYFELIEKKDPFLYDSIKQKIKYFNPAFHSMTPEGLNARLNFLNQCVRPGETIPVIGTDGKPKENDALNTSFGAPPVLILRIGDFYHTKIIPDGVSFTYEPLVLDMNPEGIGVQPMVVGVSMNFKMIGGHGIAKPVEQLQNALSFNYYANTEIYDERAVWTEDTSALDKQILQSIVDKENSVTPAEVQNPPQNNGGNTIGEILTTVPVENGNEGIISYKEIMDKLIDSTSTYFTTVVNQLEKIVLTTNYGILQLVNQDRVYSEGTVTEAVNTLAKIPIWGKSDGDSDKTKIQGKLDELFKLAYEQIENDTNPIIFELMKIDGILPSDMREIKQNMRKYIKSIEPELSNDIFTVMPDIINQEQDFVQIIRKVSVVNSKLDGKILDTGNALIYNLLEEPVEKEKSFEELEEDTVSFEKTMNNFNELLKDENILTDTYSNVGDFKPAKLTFVGGYGGQTPEKVFFMIVSRKFNNDANLQTFKNTVISGKLVDVNSPVNLYKKFEKITDDLVNKYNKELESEEKIFSSFKSSNKYKKYTEGIENRMYDKGKPRKFKYTSYTNDQTQTSIKIIKDLYSTVNLNNDRKTFDGKVKFD